jgi:hypothetical protein
VAKLSNYFLVLLFSISITDGYAVEVGFEFAGSVSIAASTPYGEIIPVSTPLHGRFVYETESTVTYTNPSCDCRGYTQQQINGFSVNFGGTHARADEYVIEITNDRVQPNQSVIDIFTVRFASNYSPPLSQPLVVDQIPRANGVISFSLVADAGLFPNSELPDSLNPNDYAFPSNFNIFSDTPTGSVDIYYTVNSMQPLSLLQSDHDLDGDVDGQDFLIWQRYFGATGQNGDADSSGTVDELDLTHWQSQYGTDIGLRSLANAVPEPNCIGLCLYLWGCFVQMRPVNSRIKRAANTPR